MTELERCLIAKERGYKYDHFTGDIIGVKGNTITHKKTNGYIVVCLSIKGKRYFILSHRLAWYLHYGELPKNQIDHIDNNKSNNKIENLRDVTNQHNHFNKHKAKGYSWNKSSKKYKACIMLNDKEIHLGYFVKEEEARAAYLEAKKKYHVIQ